MKTAFIQSSDLGSRKQRVHLLSLAFCGMLIVFLVAWFVLPVLDPAIPGTRTRFSASTGIASPTAPARQGLHFGGGATPFDRTRYIYLRMGGKVWLLEARTPLEQ